MTDRDTNREATGSSTGDATASRSAVDLYEVGARSIQVMADGSYHDLAAVTHPACVNREAEHEPPACSRPGPDGLWATALWLRAAFSELRFDIHHVVVDGDLVVVHDTMSGRQTGPFISYRDGSVARAMPPTGRRFSSRQTHWLRVRDGLVVEHWANRDDLATGEQLGWVPPSPLFLVRSAIATRRARRAAETAAR